MKTRLNMRGRAALKRLAAEIVSCPDNQAVADAACEHATNLVTGMVVKRFPPADMRVLKQYDCTEKCHAVFIENLRGVKTNRLGRAPFNFRCGGAVPLQPAGTSMVFIADDATRDAVENYILAKEALEEALKTKLADYYGLIEASVTFEQVLAVWPEAEAVRSSCGASQITVPLDDTVIRRIQADVASRRIAA